MWLKLPKMFLQGYIANNFVLYNYKLTFSAKNVVHSHMEMNILLLWKQVQSVQANFLQQIISSGRSARQ